MSDSTVERGETVERDDTAVRPAWIRWLVFALACAISWTLYLDRYAWGVVKPAIKKEYPSLSDADLGWLDSAFSATYSLCQVPSGMAADRFGPRAVLSVIIFGWSAVVAVIAMVRGYWPLFTLRAIFGVFQAGAYPTLGKVTRSWFPPTIRTAVQGAVASLSGRAGGACAALVVGTLLMGKFGIGWRGAMLLLALGGMVLSVVFWLVFRNEPRLHPWNKGRAPDSSTREALPTVAATHWRLSPDSAARQSLACLLMQVFASAFADNFFVYWVFLFLEEAKGLSRIEMGIYGSLPLWGGALGGLIGGALNDMVRRLTGNPRWARRGVGFVGETVGASLVLGSLLVEDGRQMMVILFFAKFFLDWAQPTVWGTVTDVASHGAGTMFGVVNMTGTAGAFMAGPLMGMITDTSGWNALYFLVAGMYLLAAVSWLKVDTTRPVTVPVEPQNARGEQ